MTREKIRLENERLTQALRQAEDTVAGIQQSIEQLQIECRHPSAEMRDMPVEMEYFEEEGGEVAFGYRPIRICKDCGLNAALARDTSPVRQGV